MLRRIMVAGLAAALAACGSGGGDGGSDGESARTDPPAGADVLEPPPVGSDEDRSVPAEQTGAIPEREPGVFASGPLAVRVETATLSTIGYNHSSIEYLRLGLVVTFANTGDAPMSLALAEAGPPNVMLDNTISLGDSGNYDRELSGLFQCRAAFQECRNRTPDTFLRVDPGQSLRANIVLYARTDRSRLAEAAGQDGGNLNLLVHVIEGDDVRTVPVNMPLEIQNQVTN